MVVAVSVDVRALVGRLDKLRSNQIPRAVGTALSRSGRTVRARVSRELRADLTLPAAVVREAITIERSNAVDGASRASVTLRARGGPIPLRDFRGRMTRRGATFQILKGQRRKLARAEGRVGFVVGKREGGTFTPSDRFGGHIFIRRYGSRGMRRQYGPGIATRVAGRRMRTLAAEVFRDRFETEFRAVLREFIRRAESGRPA